MRSPPEKKLHERVFALEDALAELRIKVLGDPEEEQSSGDDEHEVDSQGRRIIRAVRRMSVAMDDTFPQFAKLDFVDWDGRPHVFFVDRHALALLVPARSQPQPSPGGLTDLDPQDQESLARARRTNAEAERAELEVAAMRRDLAATAGSRSDDERVFPVLQFTVERRRPGCAELKIVGEERETLHLALTSEICLELAACLTSGAPVSVGNAHEAALARRACAEAQLVELEVAEKTRALRPTDRSIRPGSLRVEFNTDLGLTSICAADLGGWPEMKIELAPDRLVWLAEQLLHAKRRLDGAES